MISKHIFTSDVVSGKQLWINGLNSTGDLIVASTNFDIENNLKVGEDLSIGGNSVLSGNANISGDLYVGQNLTVKGTTTTLDTVNVTVDDHNIELGSVDNPTNITAEGGGITLKGDQDKTFNWQANYNGSWLSSENLGVADGKYVFTDKVRARDGAGLFLEDDGGNGIFIEDGGNVGIGTTIPDFKLTVDNGIGNEGLKVIAGNNGDSAESVFEAWNNKVNGSAPELLFKIRGDGNVGIGTASPSYPLDVRGWITAQADSLNTDAVINLAASNDNNYSAISRIKSASESNSNGSSSLTFSTRNSADAISEKMRIDSDGNVGIGTTSPGYKLHIVQSSGATGEDATPSVKIEGSQPRIWLRETDQTDLNTLIRNNGSIFEIDTVSDTDAYIQNRFAINHGNGNVRINDLLGIGKDPDGYHLDVAAPGASANGIRVQTNNDSSNAIVHIGGGGSSDIKFKVDGSGSVTTAKDVTIGGNLTVNGTTTTVNSTTVTVDDKNIELGSVASPTNTTADGGGITLKGATDKEFKWTNSSNAWNSSENLGIADGKHLFTDKVRARDSAGLRVEDDGGNGIFIQDGGNVGIGNVNPETSLDLGSNSDSSNWMTFENNLGRFQIGLSQTNAPNKKYFSLYDPDTSEHRVFVNSDGNIAVGHTEPDGKLDVEGDFVVSRNSTYESRWKIGITHTGADNYGSLFFTPEGNSSSTADWGILNKFIVKPNGYVGIGTGSPEEPLDVRGIIKTKNDGDSSEVKLVSSGGMPHINLQRGSSADWKIKAKGNGSQQVLTTSLGTSDLITVQADGNVGIGTTIPTSKLHVKSDSATPQSLGRFENPGGQALLQIKAKSDSYSILEMADAEDGNVGAIQYEHSNNNMRFKTNDSEKMRIDSSGNVGIGTTNPTQILQIGEGNSTQKDLFINFKGHVSHEQGLIFRAQDNSKRLSITTNLDSSRNNDTLSIRNHEDADLLSVGPVATVVSNNLVADGGVVISTNEDNDTPELTLRRTSSTNASGTDDIVDIRVADSSLNFIINNDSDGDSGTFSFNRMAGGAQIPADVVLGSVHLENRLRHNGDTDTYLEFHAADQFRVVTGGGERLEVTNTAIALKRDTAITGGLTISGNLTVTGKTITNDVEVVSTSNGVVFEGSVADDHEGLLKAGALTADRTYTLPNQSGTVAMTSDIKNSAITITAGNALTGGGTLNLNQSSAETITINHQDTSTASSVNNSGRTYIQDIGLDGYGHVTSLASATASNATVTVTAGGAMTGGGSFTLDGTGGTITLNHQDTSSQGSSNNSGRTYIQDISLDAYGHVTSIGTATETVVDTNTTYSTATSSTSGLVKIGYTENGKNYPVELSSGKMFVNVPWVDTNTNTQRTDAEIRTAVGGSFPNFTTAQNGKVLKVISGNLSWQDDDAGAGATSPGGSDHQVQFNNNGSFGGSANLTFDGTNLYAWQGDIVAYAASDKRLKNNISNISSPIEKIKQINGVNFEWSDKQSAYTGKDVGVIAQDVEKVLPEVVTEREDGHLAVKYEKIIPLLIEAIKDQQKEIEELKSKLS